MLSNCCWASSEIQFIIPIGLGSFFSKRLTHYFFPVLGLVPYAGHIFSLHDSKTVLAANKMNIPSAIVFIWQVLVYIKIGLIN